MGRGARAAFALVWLLAMPSAMAATGAAEGYFLTTGPLTFRGPTEAAIAPVVVFSNNTYEGQLRITSPRALVCLYEHSFAQVGSVRAAAVPKQDCLERTDLTLSSIAHEDHAGWFAILPSSEGSLSFAAPKVRVKPQAVSIFASDDANRASSGDLDQPSDSRFTKRTVGPHLLVSGEGRATFEGSALVKVKGLDVQADSDQGSFEYETGDSTSTTPGVQEVVMRWVSIEAEDLHVELTIPSRLQVAASEASRVAVEGGLSFSPVEGALRTAQATYPAAGGNATVEGSLVLSAAPASGGTGALIGMAGEIRSTTLVARPVPVSDRYGGAGWMLTAIVGAGMVVAGGTAAAVAWRVKASPRVAAVNPRMPATPPLKSPLEEVQELAASYLKRAEEAADKGDWHSCLEWLHRAGRVGPRSAKWHLEEGITLFHLRRYEEAIVAFERATLAILDGEPELWAADCALALGSLDLAESYLIDALGSPRLHPDVLGQIATETAYAPLRERERVKNGIDNALLRLRERPAPSEGEHV